MKQPAPRFPFPALLLITAITISVLLSGCGHEHQWQEATCTSPRTCSTCDETEGKALGHDWLAADCETPKTCKVCGEVTGEALGHKVTDWETLQESSCSTPGSAQGKCQVCGQTVTEARNLLDHTPGEWSVTKEATALSAGERSQLCAVCGAVVETEPFTLTEEEIRENYKANCASYSYAEISRNPGEYDGRQAKFTGEVIQVQQQKVADRLLYVLRVDVTKVRWGYDDTVYVTYSTSESDARILEDDIITMYGTLTGEKTYETVMGASVTIPSFSAEYIDIN